MSDAWLVIYTTPGSPGGDQRDPYPPVPSRTRVWVYANESEAKLKAYDLIQAGAAVKHVQVIQAENHSSNRVRGV